MIPFTQSPAWPSNIPASRFASLIRREPAGCRVGLIGLADDLGVKLNSGRPGARRGPQAFRDALARYSVADPAGWNWPTVFDAGDVAPAEGDDAGALLETHRRVTEAVSALLDHGLFPIAIGGGHDLTFPFVRAVRRRAGDLAGVYFDAHLDVRETAGSGMPFRKLIEECGVRSLDLYGFNEFANSREHLVWFKGHGGALHSLSTFPAIAHGDLFVSLDLDVLDASFAPGVSALNPCGASPAQIEPWMLAAGRAPNVRCFDIMELNPAFDPEGRTARLAAHLFLTFLKGFAERSK